MTNDHRVNEVRKELERALFKVWTNCPYFGVPLDRCRIFFDTRIDAPACVNGKWDIFINPDHPTIQKVAPERVANLLAFLIWHEVQHPLLDHFRRGRGKDPLLWNVACDLEIHQATFPTDFQMPEGILLPEKFQLPPTLTAEEYYQILLEKRNEIEEALRQAIADLQEDHTPEGEGEGGDEGENGDSQQGGIGKSGGGGEQDADSKQNGIGEVEGEIIRDQVADAINNQQRRGTNAGVGVGNTLRKWAEARRTSKVRWQSILKSAILAEKNRKRGKTLHNYNRPNPRYRPVILPRISHEKTFTVGFAIDTSGSVDDTTLAQAITEIEKILKACECEIVVVSVDEQVHTDTLKKVTSLRDLAKIQTKGGGGTDMREATEFFDKHREVDIIVVFTDGYTPYPDHTKKPCVWCVTTDSTPDTINKNWKVVRIETN